MAPSTSFFDDPKSLYTYLREVGCKLYFDVAGDVTIEPASAVTEPIRRAVQRHGEKFRDVVARGLGMKKRP